MWDGPTSDAESADEIGDPVAATAAEAVAVAEAAAAAEAAAEAAADDASLEAEPVEPPKPPPKPLGGVLVVDLSRHLPGPMVTRLLSDLGARVIKIEEPSLGDTSRQAPPIVDERSSLAALLLAGQESVGLNLKKPLARELLEELLKSADVLVESFRPGTMAGFGLDPEQLRETFPRLVICSITGWGQEGPHAQRAGHDLSYQALAGSLAAGGGIPAVQVADMIGAWSGALAVVSALWDRERSGKGAWIDQALLDAAGHAALPALAAEADGAKKVAEPLHLTGAIPCYDLYRTRDNGTLALAALEPKFWQRFCEAAGHQKLKHKQYHRTAEVRRQVALMVIERSREEWADFMNRHDIPAEPVLSMSEALEHPQVKHRELARRHEADGLMRLGYPALIDGRRPRSAPEFPSLGQHTDEVLAEFGLGGDLSPVERRRGGVGKRFSLQRWAKQVASKWVFGRRRSSGE